MKTIDAKYPRKTRQDLEKENIIYPFACCIQVLGENRRYVADGKTHFKDLTYYFDFPDDCEAYWDGKNFKVQKI